MKFGKLSRIARTGALAFTALLLVALACQPQTSQSGSAGGSGNSNKKASDFTLPQLGGGEVKLSDHEGKVVVLNFWASW